MAEELDGVLVPGPGKIFAKVIHDDPLVTFYHQFVSPEEAEHIVQLCEGRWERSLVTSGLASSLLAASAGAPARDTPLGEEAVGETRTSESVHLTFDESIVVERIAARVAHVAGTSLNFVEPLVALRYKPGQYFKLHHDGAMRSSTVFVYLNELDEGAGGETHFPRLGFQVQPTAFAAMMWRNRLPSGDADLRLKHEGKPVEKGVKYGMNCFVNARPVRDASHIVLRHLSADTEQDEQQDRQLKQWQEQQDDQHQDESKAELMRNYEDTA